MKLLGQIYVDTTALERNACRMARNLGHAPALPRGFLHKTNYVIQIVNTISSSFTESLLV